MRTFVRFIAITAVFCLAATVSFAQLAPYSQDFEGLLETGADQPDQLALNQDGWLFFVNVFNPGGGFLYNYGPGPAPNGGFGGPAISAVVLGESGPDQGLQVLSVFSNYQDPEHASGAGNLVETNVFQEQIIGADDIGKTCTFSWQHKRGNIELATTANAFIKVIDGVNFALNANPSVDTTNLSTDWSGDSLTITIDADWVGDFLQFGYSNTASNGEGSGNFQDNVDFCCDAECDGDPQGVPTTGTTAMIAFFALLATAMAFVVARGTMRRATNA